MSRLGTVSTALNLAPKVTVAFRQQLSVSLDCAGCERRCRTITFPNRETAPYCTPTNHEFDGELLDVRVNGGNVEIDFQYEFEAFKDRKYPDEKRYEGMEMGAPSWARVYFDVTCPNCHEEISNSTQSNLVRPFKSHCTCGTYLYSDEQIPTLAWTEY